MDNLELRFLDVTDFEVEERAGKSPVLKGYAVRYNTLSQDLGGFRERIKPHAFARSLSNGPDVLALAQHDNTKVLGRRSAGTLSVEDDAYGIKVSIEPPNTTFGNDIVESVRRKDISGMSFGFISKDDEFLQENGQVVREVTDADLHEVSIVTSPAYLQSRISVRSETLAKLDDFKAEIDAVETEERADEQIELQKNIDEKLEDIAEQRAEENQEETEFRMSVDMAEVISRQMKINQAASELNL